MLTILFKRSSVNMLQKEYVLPMINEINGANNTPEGTSAKENQPIVLKLTRREFKKFRQKLQEAIEISHENAQINFARSIIAKVFNGKPLFETNNRTPSWLNRSKPDKNDVLNQDKKSNNWRTFGKAAALATPALAAAAFISPSAEVQAQQPTENHSRSIETASEMYDATSQDLASYFTEEELAQITSYMDSLWLQSDSREMNNNNEKVIDVQILLTPEGAQAANGDLEAYSRVNALIEAFNTDILEPKGFAMRVIDQRTSTAHHPNLAQIRSWLITPDDGVEDNLLQERMQKGAEFTFFVTGGETNLAGYASQLVQGWENNFVPFGYAIYNVQYLTEDSQTLAHELGHLFGLAHDEANAAEPGYFIFSYGYVRNGMKDIMGLDSNNDCPCIRVKFFSNPRNTEHGFPFGIENEVDNDRTLDTTLVEMAEQLPPDPTFEEVELEDAIPEATNSGYTFRGTTAIKGPSSVELSYDNGITWYQAQITGENTWQHKFEVLPENATVIAAVNHNYLTTTPVWPEEQIYTLYLSQVKR